MSDRMSNLFSLQGKTALVTGCSRGIGRSMALALAEAGADIIGVSSSLAAGSEVEKEIRAMGRGFTAYTADLTDRTAVYALIEAVRGSEKSVDILVNNAGLILRQPAAEH